MSKVVKEKQMEVSVSDLYRVITDFESYPTFLPEVVGVEREPGAEAGRCRVKFELNLMKRFEYVLEFQMTPNEEVSWKLIRSNFFKQNEGKWVLMATPEGKTHAQYELEVGFGFFVPKWVAQKLSEVNLPVMMGQFESRAKSLTNTK